MSLKGNAGGAGELIGSVVSGGNVSGKTSIPKIIHGQTPYIKDGNWWIGEVDTGVKAEGIPGEKGDRGDTGASGKDGFSPVISVTDIEGGHRVTITDKYVTQTFDIMDGVGGGGVATYSARIADVVIRANAWVGTQSPYSQVVSVDTVTPNTQVDLTPSVEQLAIFHNKDLAFVTENDNGVVTVYAIGQKPTLDYTIQATLTEVQV